MTPDQVEALVREIVDEKFRLGLTWRLRMATAGATPGLVTMDGDTETIPVSAIGQALYSENRVWCVETPGGATYSIGSAIGTPAARIRQTSNQNLAHGVFTTITFDVADFDTVGGFDSGGAPSRYTCKVGGIYLIIGHIVFQPPSAGIQRVIHVLINGGLIPSVVTQPPINGSGTVVSTSILYHLEVDDWVEIQGFQDSGGIITTASGADAASMLQVVKVG